MNVLLRIDYNNLKMYIVISKTTLKGSQRYYKEVELKCQYRSLSGVFKNK